MKTGLLLDCSRNAVFKLSEVKKYVDYLSALGYSELYLYMEDTFEIASEPYFGYFRSKYTTEELKELDEYCYQRGIELIPAIQTLGHMGLLYRWSRFNKIIDKADILLVGDEKTYEFLDGVFKHLRGVFRTKKIHICMDEAHDLGKGKYYDLHGDEKPHDVLVKHLDTVSKLLKANGFETGFIWSDLFFRFANQTGRYHYNGLNVELFKKEAEKTPENIEVYYWQYYTNNQAEYAEMIALHKENFKSVNFANGASSWYGYAPLNEVALSACEASARACIERGVNRMMLCVWGDGGGQNSFYASLPTVVAWSEFAKGNFDYERIKEVFYRVVGEPWEKFMLLEIPNHVALDRIKAMGAANLKPLDRPLTINPSSYMTYNDYFCGAFDSFVTEGDGAIYKEHAERLKQHAGDKRFGYIFNMLAKLCEMLELKYDLGVRCRRYYQAKDKKSLQKLVDHEFTLLPERLTRFLTAYQEYWEKEKKTCGLEVEDIRIGGLIARTYHCKRMLEKYIKEDFEISELEQPLLDFYGKENQLLGIPVVCNQYLLCSTNNVLTHGIIY